MSFSSRLQVLKIERTPNPKFPNADGTPSERVAARAILLNDDGTVNTVGRLRVPKALLPKLKEGLFRAAFSLSVPDFGESKGDIVAILTDLVEELPAARQAAPKAV